MTTATGPIQAPLRAAWPEGFAAFTLPHLGVVLASLLGLGALLWLGRWTAARGHEGRTAAIIGHLGACVWSAMMYRQIVVPDPTEPGAWHDRLPLQICDWLSLIGPLYLITGRRWMATLLWCVGVGLSTQAFVTPIVRHGPVYPRFWEFWAFHWLVVFPPIYAVVVRGYRPWWRDFRLAVAVMLGYTLLVMPINVRFGANFAFLGDSSAGAPTLADVLGPWPARVPVIIALAMAAMALTVAPWSVLRARRARRVP
ncbi:MAG: TIGR02206 family membrane protein [Planctomyces sp.]|nr:TIGR02206 family membrane protein [Planctomyces sp.]MBA4119387.1 TIGR02206 family membrane protein [Isosphaera sp.]